MNDLTHKELEVMVEALDSWERDARSMGGLFAEVMMSRLAKDNPEAQRALKEQQAERETKEKKEVIRRKRVATSIKARLYEQMEQLEINNITKQNGDSDAGN